MDPPLSDKARQTSDKQVSTALSSHPVTSMKKSVVDSLTVVCAPLIIGGKERISSLESKITG